MNPSTAGRARVSGADGGRRRAAAGAGVARCGRLGRDPDGDHGAVTRLGLDAQLAAREPRALAHPGEPERADARERVEVVGRLEAGAVVGDGQHARSPSRRRWTSTRGRAA